MMVLVMNVPLFFLGWRYLGGRRFFRPHDFHRRAVQRVGRRGPPGDSRRPDAKPDAQCVVWRRVGGLGMGITFLGQGTAGGTDILARVLARLRGISLSQSYLFTDAAVIFLPALPLAGNRRSMR